MNILLFFIEVVVCFGSLILITKFLGKEGAIAWIAIASVLANIFTVKQADLFGDLSYTLGTVMFASTFLAGDIITEKWGAKFARKGIFIGMIATLTLIVGSQLAIAYAPAAFTIDPNTGVCDIQEALKTVFNLSLRVSISSVIMYFVANIVSIQLYDFLKRKMNGKHKWFRNNVATIICNTAENFLFMYGAFLFAPDFDVGTIAIMAATTSLVEFVIGLLDTPFLYLATAKWNKDVNLAKDGE